MLMRRRLLNLNTRVISHTTLRSPPLLCLRQLPPQVTAVRSRTFARLSPQKPQENFLPEVPHKSNAVIEDGGSIILSDEQQRVLDMVVAGESVFFTGSAGES